jgi:hypothetical protein
MKKISKRPIQTNFIIEFINKNQNFYLVSVDNIKDLKKENILLLKKSLYKYLLPGQFSLPLRNLFKSHSYINFDLNKGSFKDLINKSNIIVFNYNNNVFLNTSQILKPIKVREIFNKKLLRGFLFVCFLFYVD